MTERTGVPTLLGLAHRMCQVIVKFTPILTAKYSANPALLAALTAANAACGVLAAELALVREHGD